MINKKNKVFLLIVFTLCLIMFPSMCTAQNADIEFKSISSTSILTIDNLYFNPIKYINYSNTSQTFGLAGVVKNNGSTGKAFTATATFYDKDYNLVATLKTNQYVPAYEKNSYSNVGNISQIKEGYTVDDIYYYSLSVGNSHVITNNEIITGSYNQDYSKYDYVINNYNINMVVNENNTFDITETITVYFNVAKHGIYRKIPLKNTVTRLDGTKSNNRAQVSNIIVSHEHKSSVENGYKVIKIGNANKTLTGVHTYTIKYNYNIGKDPLKEADELYFNLIGDEWDTIIKNVSFSITMPKSFDKSSLGFSSGKTGSTDSSNVKYTVSENTITGMLNKELTSGQALTVRLSLPDGYFVGAGFEVDKFSICVIIVCLVFVFISYMLWVKYGKDKPVVETVEFYPPEGYNSAEVGFMYEGTVSNKSKYRYLFIWQIKGI